LDSPKECVAAIQSQIGIPMPDWFLQQQAAKKRKGMPKGVPKLLRELSPLHPFPAIICESRDLRLSLSHFDSLPHKAVYHPDLQMHRLHPTLLNNTSTGRLSCQEPNVQSLAKLVEYRTVSSTRHSHTHGGGCLQTVCECGFLLISLSLLSCVLPWFAPSRLPSHL
jgi:hypothetical protein